SNSRSGHKKIRRSTGENVLSGFDGIVVACIGGETRQVQFVLSCWREIFRDAVQLAALCAETRAAERRPAAPPAHDDIRSGAALEIRPAVQAYDIVRAQLQ